MERLRMFLTGCAIVCLFTPVINKLFEQNPHKADRIIHITAFALLFVLCFYASLKTNWEVVEKRLEKDVRDYRNTQRNIWKFF